MSCCNGYYIHPFPISQCLNFPFVAYFQQWHCVNPTMSGLGGCVTGLCDSVNECHWPAVTIVWDDLTHPLWPWGYSAVCLALVRLYQGQGSEAWFLYVVILLHCVAYMLLEDNTIMSACQVGVWPQGVLYGMHLHWLQDLLNLPMGKLAQCTLPPTPV